MFFMWIDINNIGFIMIFWEDETGYYGVLWSEKPSDAIEQKRKTDKHLKSRRLFNNWYEVGALDSI